MVVYTPGVTGRTQGDQPNAGTWNQQAPPPQQGTYFITGDNMNNLPDQTAPRGASLLSRAPVEATQIDENMNIEQPLTHLFFIQTGTQGPSRCLHATHNTYCILCDQKPFLNSFVTHTHNTSYSPPKKRQDIDLIPCSLSIINSIQKTLTSLPLQVLFDSGSDNTFVHEHSLPPGATPRVIKKLSGQTLAGLLSTSREVELQQLLLPKFSRSARVDEQHAYAFAGKCDYDIIFGRDFLRNWHEARL